MDVADAQTAGLILPSPVPLQLNKYFLAVSSRGNLDHKYPNIPDY